MSTIGNWNPRQLAIRVLARPKATGVVSLREILKASQEFHTRLGFTTKVHCEHLKRNDGASEEYLVRLAYQPNFFPYVQVMAQTIYLSELTREIDQLGGRAVAMVFLVDYDIAGSEWTNTAKVYDPGIKGQVRTFSIADGSLRNAPSCFASGPTAETRLLLAEQMAAYCKSFKESPEFLLQLSGLGEEFDTLAEFNSYAWMNVALNHWQIPICFVPLSELSKKFPGGHEMLAQKIASSLGGKYDTHLWSMCKGCNARQNFGTTCGNLECPGPITIPKVLVDNLADYTSYGVDGGTCYESGKSHLVKSHEVAAICDLPVAPESCWRLEYESGLKEMYPEASGYASGAKKLLLGGRASLLQHFRTPTDGMQFKNALLQSLSAQ